MTDTAQITRFAPHGPEPDGLTEWERMDPANLVSGEPVQRGHTYHENPDAGYMSGVWDCTAFTDHMMPYPVDEFMFLLEGSVTMGLPDGTEVTVGAGQAFVIPKGFECQWKQPGYVRKYFMILDGPVPGGAANPSLSRITVPDLTATPADLETARTDFINAAGNMQVHVRMLAAMALPALPVTANLLIQVLDGGLTLTSGDASHRFAPGETAYIRQGGTIGWQADAGTRLLQASHTTG